MAVSVRGKRGESSRWINPVETGRTLEYQPNNQNVSGCFLGRRGFTLKVDFQNWFLASCTDHDLVKVSILVDGDLKILPYSGWHRPQ
jgi:hypothetical protein